MAMLPVMAGASLLGSFMQSNSNKKAAQSNQNAENSIDNQLLGVYNQMMGKYNQAWGAINPVGALNQAKNFYSSEVSGGLSPAVTGAAESQFQQGNAQNLATLKNQLGPYTPNMAGTIADFQNNEITGNVSLQQQLAVMNQQVRSQGAQGLAGIGSGVMNWGSSIMNDVAGGLGTLGQGFQQAGEFNATEANNNNPFSSLGGILSSFPQLATMYPGLFGSGSSSSPGQGGLGATGGGGGGSTGGSGGSFGR